jgi:hypothetical protein
MRDGFQRFWCDWDESVDEANQFDQWSTQLT